MSRLCFLSEWLDPMSGVLWKYQLFFYKDTQEVEMVDIKNRRTFLKRTPVANVTLSQLFVGSTVTVFSRQLKIIDFGDDFTRNQMEEKEERTLAMVKPDAFQHLGKIVNAIVESGFRINNMRVCQLSKQDAEAFYSVHRGKPFYDNLTTFMSSGRICAMELAGKAAIRAWRELIGPTDSNRARAEAPNSIRASFGKDGSQNAVHGSDAPDTAEQEIRFFFSDPFVGRCDVGRNTTLGIIKPHSVMDGVAGLLLDCVSEAFDIVALRQVTLNKAAAAEFYEVYKGVVSIGEFNGMVDELTSGPCIAFELASRSGADPVEAFRSLCGPADPEMARVLRPKSIRAQFGLNKTKNAIHCTDLEEDGSLEIEYFFSILPAAA